MVFLKKKPKSLKNSWYIRDGIRIEIPFFEARGFKSEYKDIRKDWPWYGGDNLKLREFRNFPSERCTKFLSCGEDHPLANTGSQKQTMRGTGFEPVYPLRDRMSSPALSPAQLTRLCSQRPQAVACRLPPHCLASPTSAQRFKKLLPEKALQKAACAEAPQKSAPHLFARTSSMSSFASAATFFSPWIFSSRVRTFTVVFFTSLSPTTRM